VEIVKIMKDPNIGVFREELKISKNLIDWSTVASRWLELIN